VKLGTGLITCRGEPVRGVAAAHSCREAPAPPVEKIHQPWERIHRLRSDIVEFVTRPGAFHQPVVKHAGIMAPGCDKRRWAEARGHDHAVAYAHGAPYPQNKIRDGLIELRDGL
jgi:hypothetical protein